MKKITIYHTVPYMVQASNGDWNNVHSVTMEAQKAMLANNIIYITGKAGDKMEIRLACSDYVVIEEES